MRQYKTTHHLAPLDLWYKKHKHLFKITQVEHYDDLYDNVLALEDEEGDIGLRMTTLLEYKSKLMNDWKDKGLLEEK